MLLIIVVAEFAAVIDLRIIVIIAAEDAGFRQQVE